MAQWKSKLRIRMMLAHAGILVAAVLFLEIVCACIMFFSGVFSPGSDVPVVSNAGYIAHASFAKVAGGFFLATAIILLVTIPAGAVVSFIATRRQLNRMQCLVDATTQFVAGQYQRRVQVMSEDEFGLLERQFNLMGEQLVESIEQRRLLVEQNARLAERARILRDLHDGVKQQAFALTMQISTACTLLDAQPEAARIALQHSEALAYQVQQELTALIQSSRPSVLAEKGFALALQEYVTTWSQQQHIPVQSHIDACTLPPLLEEALLRIIQEALSNSARHSRASAVTLNLVCERGSVTLLLADNGCGFDPDDPALELKKGVGLRSMHGRVEAFQGTLCIESERGVGTRIVVRCSYPVEHEAPAEVQVTAPLLSDCEVAR